MNADAQHQADRIADIHLCRNRYDRLGHDFANKHDFGVMAWNKAITRMIGSRSLNEIHRFFKRAGKIVDAKDPLTLPSIIIKIFLRWPQRVNLGL